MKNICRLFSFLFLVLLFSSASKAQSPALPCPAGSVCSGSVTFTVTFGAPTTPTSVSPNSATQGSPSITLTLTAAAGSQFNSTMVVEWCQVTPAPCSSPTPLTTSFVSVSSLTASLPAAQLTSSGTFAIYLSQPSGGHAQNSAPNEILGPVTDALFCGFLTCTSFPGEVLTTVDVVAVAKS